MTKESQPVISEQQRWNNLAHIQRISERAILTSRPLYWRDHINVLLFFALVISLLTAVMNWLAPMTSLVTGLIAVLIYALASAAFRRARAPHWAHRLQTELKNYKPVNHAAFNSFMRELKSSEHVSPSAVQRWLIEERMAIACVGPFARLNGAGVAVMGDESKNGLSPEQSNANFHIVHASPDGENSK